MMNSLECSSCDWLQMKSIAQILVARSWRRVDTRRRPGRGQCDVVPICCKRLLRQPIVLTWHRNRLATIDVVTLAFNIPIARSRSTCAKFCHRKLAMCNLNSKLFCMFLDVWDVRLEISVASTHVNLNGMSVHVKNRKMENRSVRWFWLIHLNKLMGKMCGRKNSKA